MEQEFEVLRVWVDDKEDVHGVIAHADVKVRGIQIRFIKIVKDKRTGSEYCAMPSRKVFVPAVGKTLHSSIVIIEDDLRAKIYTAVLHEYRLKQLKFQGGGVDEV